MLIKNKKIFKGFTLVELIIVITILSILATIAFISFQGYTKNARDGNRVTTLKNISKGLDINQIQAGEYPFPEGEILTGIINNQELTYKGKIGNSLSRLLKINTIPQDPITQNNYTYAVTKDKKQYQIGSILEGDISYQKIVPTTYADTYYGKVEGNYKGYLTFGSGTNNSELWLANIPSILYNFSGAISTTGIDLLDLDKTYYIIEKGVNLPYAPVGVEKNNKLTQEILKDKTKNTQAKLIIIKKDDLLTFIKDETIPNYLGGTSTGELLGSFGMNTKEGLKNLIEGTNSSITAPTQTPGCETQPTYTNAIFTTGAPTQPNQIWQSNSETEACYWTCGVGKVLSGSECILESCSGTTPNGTSQITNATSIVGGAWHYETTAGICTYECGAGYYYNSGNCIASSQGYYVGTQGQELQTECGGNDKYQDEEGQTSCKSVSAGYYTTGGTSTTRTGQVQCEAGYYCNGGVKTACSTNYTSSVGSTNISECVPITYNITFDGNGATSGNMVVQTITQGATVNLTNNTFTRTNYIFLGWSTDQSATSATYTNGASYTMGTSDLNLYAIWYQPTTTLDSGGNTAGVMPYLKSVTAGNFSCYSGTCNSTLSNNGVVYDSVTGLYWQSGYPSSTYTWANAESYCFYLVLGGIDIWRLPDITELVSIMDYGKNPSIDTSYFAVANSFYWSSTTYASNGSNAIGSNFYNGNIDSFSKATSYYVKCVY